MDLPVQQFTTKAEQGYLDLFETAQEALPGARDPFVSDLRATAIGTYGRIGLPHRRIEAWKYTDLRARLTSINPLIKADGAAAGDAELGQALRSEIANLSAYRLVMVEGDLRADLSDLAGLKAAGVEAVSLARALEKPQAWLKEALAHVNPRDDDPVLALNTALMTGGVALRVREGVILDKPIHLIAIDGAGDPASTFTRNVVIAEPDSAATVIESFASQRNLQRNAVTELRVCAKAAVKHVKVERESGDAFHLSTWLVELGADARYDAFQFSTGAALARNQIYLRFAGEGAAADISGAFLLRDRQPVRAERARHADVFTGKQLDAEVVAERRRMRGGRAAHERQRDEERDGTGFHGQLLVRQRCWLDPRGFARVALRRVTNL